MKLVPTRRTDYAIRALLFLANDPSERSKADDIAEAMNIPRGFLPQVLQALQRAGLITSRASRSGGYALARPAEGITLLDIVESLEAPLDSGECVLKGGPCHWEDVCAVHWVWSGAREALAGQLASASLARIAADEHTDGSARPAARLDNRRSQPHKRTLVQWRLAGRTPNAVGPE